MSWEDLLKMDPAELAGRLRAAEDKLSQRETQKVFQEPRKSGNKRLSRESGIEIMNAMSNELFPDRPAIVREHWQTKRCCRCDECLRYFEEGPYQKGVTNG